jgi:hypothetical protein
LQPEKGVTDVITADSLRYWRWGGSAQRPVHTYPGDRAGRCVGQILQNAFDFVFFTLYSKWKTKSCSQG